MTIASAKWFALTTILFFGHVALAQQNPDGQLPVTTAAQPYLFLIRDPAVHDDLQLNAQQRQAIDALNNEWDAALWSMRNKSAEHIDDSMDRATAAAKTRLASILTLSQQQRLEQIEMWTLGTKAFLRDDFADKLELSQGQRDEIRETAARTEQAVAQLVKKLESGGSRQSLEREAQRLRAGQQKRIAATLNSRQHRRLMTLLGKRIDLSQLGRVRFQAPELEGQDGWLNSPPLTLRQLKGKVVALHFYAFA